MMLPGPQSVFCGFWKHRHHRSQTKPKQVDYQDTEEYTSGVCRPQRPSETDASVSAIVEQIPLTSDQQKITYKRRSNFKRSIPPGQSTIIRSIGSRLDEQVKEHEYDIKNKLMPTRICIIISAKLTIKYNINIEISHQITNFLITDHKNQR